MGLRVRELESKLSKASLGVLPAIVGHIDLLGGLTFLPGNLRTSVERDCKEINEAAKVGSCESCNRHVRFRGRSICSACCKPMNRRPKLRPAGWRPLHRRQVDRSCSKRRRSRSTNGPPSRHKGAPPSFVRARWAPMRPRTRTCYVTTGISSTPARPPGPIGSWTHTRPRLPFQSLISSLTECVSRTQVRIAKVASEAASRACNSASPRAPLCTRNVWMVATQVRLGVSAPRRRRKRR